MRNTDLAWASGIFDGEGYVSMTVAKAGVNRRVSTSYQIRLGVTMTHRATIERLCAMFDTRLVVKRSRNPRHRETYTWQLYDQTGYDAAHQLLRFSVTKREQLNLYIGFRDQCFMEVPRGRGAKTPEHIVQLRRDYFERLRRLNQKGPAK